MSQAPRLLAAAWIAVLLGCSIEPNPAPGPMAAVDREGSDEVPGGTDGGYGTRTPDDLGWLAGPGDDLGSEPIAPDAAAGAADAGVADAGAEDAGGRSADLPETGCEEGVVCVTALPFHDASDTLAGAAAIDAYACKPEADESGPEIVYRVLVPTAGFLSAAVYDEGEVDVDVHILSKKDGAACLARGHHHAAAEVAAGEYWVVVDSFVSGGTVLGGPFTVDIGLSVPSVGPCAMEAGIMKRVGDGGDHLVMPATGPIVLEAHLVTQEEPPPYPSGPTDELDEHYALSQAATGLVMHRQQHFAPLEGGSFYGAGIGSPDLVPVVEEGWYVNMYWTKESRPKRGTRMLLRLPGESRAVVVAAGHETGPGNLAHIGGTPEETHFYLGTTHLSVMTIGIAGDQSLPFGPRACTD